MSKIYCIVVMWKLNIKCKRIGRIIFIIIIGVATEMKIKRKKRRKTKKNTQWMRLWWKNIVEIIKHYKDHALEVYFIFSIKRKQRKKNMKNTKKLMKFIILTHHHCDSKQYFHHNASILDVLVWHWWLNT